MSGYSMRSDTAIAQFENDNALRNYPFWEGSSLVDDQGRSLSKNVVVDLHMIVPADIEVPPDEHGDRPDFVNVELPYVKMTSVHLSKSMVSACFASAFNGDTSALSVTVSAENFRPYVPYRLNKLVGSYDIGGIVTFGEIEFPDFPETYRFNPNGIEGNSFNPLGLNAVIHPSCVAVSKAPRLRSIVDSRSGARLNGDVGIDFSGFIKASKSGNKFLLELEDGAASMLMSKCAGLQESADLCGATPIRSINGIRPDEDGNIVLWFH